MNNNIVDIFEPCSKSCFYISFFERNIDITNAFYELKVILIGTSEYFTLPVKYLQNLGPWELCFVPILLLTKI